MKAPIHAGMVLNNPQDPIRRAATISERDLYEAIGRVIDGAPMDKICEALANHLVNMVRTAHPTKGRAEKRWDDFFGRKKSLMLESYDSVTGRRRATFPHHQVITPAHFVARDGFKRN